MKTRLFISALIFSYHFGQPVFGQSTVGPTMIGSTDCGQWVNIKRPTDRSWVLGYISGMNTMFAMSRHFTANPLSSVKSADQIIVWMDNYCQKNPLKTVAEGASDLYILEILKLEKQQK